MLVKIQFLLVFDPILAAGLAQALGAVAGVIQGIGLVAASGGLIGAAVSAIRPESPNLARGQGGGNEPPCKTDAVEKFERDVFARMEAPAPRRTIDGGDEKAAHRQLQRASFLALANATVRA
jgi:hypothetical protein